jgi:hypothetical protein
MGLDNYLINGDNYAFKEKINEFNHNTDEHISMYEDISLSNEEIEQKENLSVKDEYLESLEFCKVCFDKATGIHYGVATCEGCKVN